jgi:protein gp37
MKANLHKFNKINSLIDWAKYSWNPVTGCLNGCNYCYARDMTNHYPKIFPNGFEPTFHPERLLDPANTKLPKAANNGKRNVLVCSMGDLFGDWVPQDWIDHVIETCKKSPAWTYIFSTKNPKRLIGTNWPKNAWVGTSIDCQNRISSALPVFKELNEHQFRPGALFVSCEPMNERIDFGEHGLDVFDWIIVCGRSASSGMKAFQPEKAWVESLHESARKSGCMIYDKPNLKVKGLTINPKEFPNQRKIRHAIPEIKAEAQAALVQISVAKYLL